MQRADIGDNTTIYSLGWEKIEIESGRLRGKANLNALNESDYKEQEVNESEDFFITSTENAAQGHKKEEKKSGSMNKTIKDRKEHCGEIKT